MQQKAVLKLDLHDEKDKKKAMKIVSRLTGIDLIAMSLKDGKLTVAGDFDPVLLVEKLRKLFPTNIESVGPAKDEKKGSDQANDGNKKGDDKNNNAGGKDQKGGGGGGSGDKVVPITYYPPYPYQYYPLRPAPPLYYYDHLRSIEEDPNGCVIC